MDQRPLQVSRVTQVSIPKGNINSVVNSSTVVSCAPAVATSAGNVSAVRYQIMTTPTDLAARSACQVPFIFKSPQSSPPPPELITTNTAQHYIMDNSNQTLKSVQMVQPVVQPVQTVQAVVLTTTSGNGNSPTVQSPQVFATTPNGQVLPVIPASTAIINAASVPVTTVPVAVSVSPNPSFVKVEKKIPRVDKVPQQGRHRKVVNILTNQSPSVQQNTHQGQQKQQLQLSSQAQQTIKPQTIEKGTEGPKQPRLQQPLSQSQQRQPHAQLQQKQPTPQTQSLTTLRQQQSQTQAQSHPRQHPQIQLQQRLQPQGQPLQRPQSQTQSPQRLQQPLSQSQQRSQQQQTPSQPQQRDSSATSPALMTCNNTLVVTKSIKSYSLCKTRKKDKEDQVPTVGFTAANKTVEQQLQTRRPAITISPIPRSVSVANNSNVTNTSSSSKLIEEKKPKDVVQNHPQQQQLQQQLVPPQKVVGIQTTPNISSSNCQQLLIVMSNNGEEQWLQFSGNPMTTDLAEMLKKSGVPDSQIEECKAAIMESQPQINDNSNISGNNSNISNSTTSSTTTVAASVTNVSTNVGDGDQVKNDQNAIPAENRVGKFALCPHCGLSSPTFDQCARCKCVFPPDVKCIPIKNYRTLDKNSQIAPQLIGRSAHNLTRKCSTDSSGNSNGSSPECPKKKARIQEKRRSKKVEEPVCLTISSDEENDEPEGLTNRSGASKSGDSSCNDNKYNFSCDPAITQAAMLKEPVINDDNSSSLSLESMETEESSEKAPVNPADNRLQLMNLNDERLLAPSDFIENIVCRTVRIGSYKVVPSDDIIFNARIVSITVPSIMESGKTICIRIPYTQVVKVLAHYGRGMPVFFIYTTTVMGAKIRALLDMTSKDGYYYDPSSKVETQRRITLLPERLNDDTKNKIKSILYDANKNIHEELSSKEANDILVRASPKEVQNILKKTGMPPPVPAIQTIMVYPPPPMKGGIPINTEDYACLGEDQFLNDVIIDFYLKYLTQVMLRDEDQARTHVFSSFFYKRLTTKPTGTRRSYNPTEDNPETKPPEKRHSRVKSWTKAVNIFTKDFIIIPINENCHWFLAIICFPGLTGPVRFSDNTPITLPDTKPKRRHSSLMEGCTDKELASNVMAGKTSLMIGSTTITAVNTAVTVSVPPQPPSTITLEPEEEDRDEADGVDEDFEDELSEDDQDGSDNNKGNENQQLPLMKDPSPENEEEDCRKRLQPDDSAKRQTTSIPSSTSSKSSNTYKTAIREPIKQPCILIFDSLAGASRAKVVATLRDYLRIEYRTKHGHDRDFSPSVMKGASPKVPQQTNYTDCGLYVLQYVEAFFQAPVTDYHMPIKMLQNWFTSDVVSRKRYDIQQLLLQLMSEQNVDIASLNLPDLNLRPPGIVPYPDTDPEDMEEGEEEEEEEEDDEDSRYCREFMELYGEIDEDGEEEEEEGEIDEEEEEGEEGEYHNYDEDMYNVCLEDEEEHMENMSCGGDHIDSEECEEGHISKMDYKELLEEPMPKIDLKSYRIPRLIRDVKKTPNRHESDVNKMPQHSE